RSAHPQHLHPFPTRRSSDLTAFRAAAFNDPAPRFRAEERACHASADLEAAARPSRRRAERTALARLVVGLVRDRERLMACCALRDRKSTRLNSSHLVISYAV